MAKHSKETVAEAEDDLREALSCSAQEAGTREGYSLKAKKDVQRMDVIIVWRGGKPTSTGRTDYYDVYVYRVWNGATELHRITWSTHVACGFSLGRGDYRDYLRIGGCGFSKPFEIVQRLQKYAPEGVELNERFI